MRFRKRFSKSRKGKRMSFSRRGVSRRYVKKGKKLGRVVSRGGMRF